MFSTTTPKSFCRSGAYCFSNYGSDCSPDTLLKIPLNHIIKASPPLFVSHLGSYNQVFVILTPLIFSLFKMLLPKFSHILLQYLSLLGSKLIVVRSKSYSVWVITESGSKYKEHHRKTANNWHAKLCWSLDYHLTENKFPEGSYRWRKLFSWSWRICNTTNYILIIVVDATKVLTAFANIDWLVLNTM